MKGTVRLHYVDEKGTGHTSAFIFENRPLIVFDSFAQQTPIATNAISLDPTELSWTSHAEFFVFLEAHPKYEVVLCYLLSKYMTLQGDQAKL